MGRWDPQDEEVAQAAIDELGDRVEARLRARGADPDDGWAAHSLLHHKWAYLDGHLTRWTTDDLAELLTGIFPRKVIVDPGEEDVVLAGAHELVDLLVEDDLLAAGSSSPRALHRAIDRLRPAFVASMGDPSRFGPGKALFSAMRAEGVDIEDPTAIAAWQEDFNRRPRTERDRVLGSVAPDATLTGGGGGPASHPTGGGGGRASHPTGGGPPGERLAPGTFPPLELLPAEELAAAALDAPMVRQLRGLVTYVGEQLPLTDRGNLKLADGRRLVTELDTGDRMDEWIGDRQFKTRSTDAWSRAACAAS